MPAEPKQEPGEGFSEAEATRIAVELSARWNEYVIFTKASDEPPDLSDFFAWCFFTQGWDARGAAEGLDETNADHEKQGPWNGPGHWLGRLNLHQHSTAPYRRHDNCSGGRSTVHLHCGFPAGDNPHLIFRQAARGQTERTDI